MSHPSSTEIYGNQVMQNPRGETMFRCGMDRATWYLERNLAVRVDEYTLRLTFEPKGDGYKNDPFYLQERKNVCVVCGKIGNLSRHHVVPHCYRKHLPEHIKSSSFHDVLALCIDCHEKYEKIHSYDMRMKLAEKYNAPLSGKGLLVDNFSIFARGAAKALTYYSDKIPLHRKEVLKNRIRSFFGRDLSFNEMKEFVSMMDGFKRVKKGTHYKSHGQIVIDQVDNLQEFVEMWRSHFIETMNPQYLPKGWDIKKNIYRD